MFTVLSNTRNSKLYLIVAVIILLAVFLTVAIPPSIVTPKPALIPVTGVQDANKLFHQAEERSLYNRPASSIRDESFFEYRRGEWSAKPIDSRYEFRRGEWFGN
jgi:hypothetical protein